MSDMRFGLKFIAYFLALAFSAIAAGSALIHYGNKELVESRYAELESVSRMKAKGVLEWRRSLEGMGNYLSANQDTAAPFEAALDGRPGGEAAARKASRALCAAFGLRGLRLYAAGRLGASGSKPVFAYPDHAAAGPGGDDTASAPLDRASLGDLNLCAGDGLPAIALRAPLPGPEAGRPRGLLVLDADPKVYLYPYIQEWPIAASKSGESILVRREGEEVLFLNELRFKSGTALKLRYPLSSFPQLPATRAALGKSGPARGIDYRGRRVLAWTQPLEGTEWSLVVKMDEDEASGDLRRMNLAVGSAAVLLILASGFSMRAAWRRERAELGLRMKAAELDRLAIARRFEYLTRFANDAITLSGQDLVFCETNESASALYGYAEGGLLGLSLREVWTDAPPYLLEDGTLDTGDRKYSFESQRRRRDGGLVWVQVAARVFPMDGKLFLQEIVRDVTKARADREIILKSIEEKEMLLKELHHRTKNNMQVISSLMMLQAGESEDETIVQAFMEMIGRIRSMALVHEKLYRSTDLTSVELRSYVRELIELLVLDFSRGNIDVRVDAKEPIPVSLDFAIPCGLVVNELVTNSFKYAFGGTQGGSVAVELERTEAGSVLMRFRDSGPGFPPGFEPRERGRMGWQTIIALVENQLRGTFEILPGPGANISIDLLTMPPYEGA